MKRPGPGIVRGGPGIVNRVRRAAAATG
jgi:hypothetical protein